MFFDSVLFPNQLLFRTIRYLGGIADFFSGRYRWIHDVHDLLFAFHNLRCARLLYFSTSVCHRHALGSALVWLCPLSRRNFIDFDKFLFGFGYGLFPVGFSPFRDMINCRFFFKVFVLRVLRIIELLRLQDVCGASDHNRLIHRHGIYLIYIDQVSPHLALAECVISRDMDGT